jgi:hypothetical protein
MGILEKIPTFLTVGVLVIIFVCLKRQARSPRLALWTFGWALVFTQFPGTTAGVRPGRRQFPSAGRRFRIAAGCCGLFSSLRLLRSERLREANLPPIHARCAFCRVRGMHML